MKQLEQKEFSTFLIEYHNHGYRSLKPLMLWIDDNEVYHNIESELRKLCYCKAVPYICLMHTDPLGISNDDSDEINKIAPIDEDCRLFLEENFENYSIK